ncbi:MAG: hypothetical protein GX827_08960 [Clostridiales bacterium]|jgi:hypothetical protein|nr:hypothetical protein [Clostridiales bacterium]
MKAKENENIEFSGGTVDIESETGLLRACEAYFEDCREKGCVATAAGFRFSLGMTSREMEELAGRFPRAKDLMRARFIDEAVNRKVPNTSSTMAFLLELADSFGDTAHIDLTDGE